MLTCKTQSCPAENSSFIYHHSWTGGHSAGGRAACPECCGMTSCPWKHIYNRLFAWRSVTGLWPPNDSCCLQGKWTRLLGKKSFAPICSKLEVTSCVRYLSMRHMRKNGPSSFMLWCIWYLAFALLSFIFQQLCEKINWVGASQGQHSFSQTGTLLCFLLLFCSNCK